MQIVIDINELDFEVIKEVNELGGEWKTDIASKCMKAIANGTPLPKGHGRLIDADKLNRIMYHKAFETDSDMQKWDSGCWIRYKMFENSIKEMPTIIEADTESEGKE